MDLFCLSDRPDNLPVLLHALHLQTFMDWGVTVLDYSEDGDCERVADRVARHFFTTRAQIRTKRVTRANGPGTRSTLAQNSRADVVGYTPDDAYYAPTYLEHMIAALQRGHDIVACDWVSERGRYEARQAHPGAVHCDSGAMLVRRALFESLRPGNLDALFLTAAIHAGARTCRVPGLLCVRN